MDVLVSGSTGFIGSALLPELRRQGHSVRRLVRGPAQGRDVSWDIDARMLDPHALEGVDAVVHLAGEGIAEKRWTDAQKQRVLDSRVQGTTLLCEALASLKRKPSVLASGSAIGFYGDRGDEELTEESSAGTGFLADVVQAWEASTAPAEAAGIRTVHLRTGIVMSAEGGALKKQLLPFRLGIGGRLGSGNQWVSWISLADEVGAIIHALGATSLEGSVNLTAPTPVPNAEFTKALGHALHRPTVLPIPSFAIKTLFGGEMAREMLLAGQRVLPTRLQASGYAFHDPTLETTLEALLAS